MVRARLLWAASCSSLAMRFIFLSSGPSSFLPKADSFSRESSSSQHCCPAARLGAEEPRGQGEEARPAASTGHQAEPACAPHPGRGDLGQQQFLRQRGGDAQAAP